MRYCTKCGKELIDGQRFCGYCGTQVTDEPADETPVVEEPATILCSHCKNEVPADMLFCPECGYRLDKKRTAAASSASKTTSETTSERKSETASQATSDSILKSNAYQEPASEPIQPKVTPTPLAPSEYGGIADKFIRQQTYVYFGMGAFKCEDVYLLRAKLNVPADAVHYLAIDTTTLGRGKNGFIITDKGIYSKQLFGNPQYISWDEFLSTEIKRIDNMARVEINFKYPNKIEFFGNKDECDNLLMFFTQLQVYMKQTIEMGKP